MVGLGNVDNTADANKPISTATLAALENCTKQYSLTSPYTDLGWVLAGRATMSQGERIMFRLYAGQGYNANNSQLNIYTLMFSTSNGISSQPATNNGTAFYGNGVAYMYGPKNDAPALCRIVQESQTQYAFYFQLGGFAGDNLMEFGGATFTYLNTAVGTTWSITGAYLEPPTYTMIHSNNVATQLSALGYAKKPWATGYVSAGQTGGTVIAASFGASTTNTVSSSNTVENGTPTGTMYTITLGTALPTTTPCITATIAGTEFGVALASYINSTRIQIYASPGCPFYFTVIAQ
jgi:hypothetical protein